MLVLIQGPTWNEARFPGQGHLGSPEHDDVGMVLIHPVQHGEGCFVPEDGRHQVGSGQWQQQGLDRRSWDNNKLKNLTFINSLIYIYSY